ncbi:MAG: hypothetical protein ABSH38_11405 [Verrucomicrobiota bacterium]|jgi:dCTP deaminase
MFWSTQTIKHKLDETKHKNLPLIWPYDKNRVNRGAYELSLSRKILITPDESTTGLRSVTEEALRIPPGQFALLFSEECVNIPPNVIAFISLKGGVKFKGLINISGFQVDPGFPGHIKFSVYNASGEDVHLNFLEPCFLIWFATLDAEDEDHKGGTHRDQSGFTTEDRDRMSKPRHSPETLHARLKSIEESVDRMKIIGVVVIFPLIIGLVAAMFDHWFGEKADRIGVGALIIFTALFVGIAVLLLGRFFRRK